METKKLERKWAKFVIKAAIVAAICWPLGQYLPYHMQDGVMVRDWLHYVKLALWCTGFIAFVSAVVHGWQKLSCPYCGKGHAMPWQGVGKVKICRHCGKPMEFDDEV